MCRRRGSIPGWADRTKSRTGRLALGGLLPKYSQCEWWRRVRGQLYDCFLILDCHHALEGERLTRKECKCGNEFMGHPIKRDAKSVSKRKRNGNDGSRSRPLEPARFVSSSCQCKVEMSGFLPDRDVRFHGLLQGWFAGAWYLGLILFLGLGVCCASPGGRRPEGLADGRSGSGQARRCR